MHWLKLELKLLFAGVTAKVSFIVVVLCALLAIHLGQQSYQKVYKEQVTVNAKMQAQLHELEQRSELPTAGNMGYYVAATTRWQLNPWSALFVGQSQSAYASMPVRALALQGQIYNREMINPSWQQAGRLDLGFVLIYLLPLMLGVLAVTLLSEEQQANRWRLLSALGKGGKQLIFIRLGLITTVVLATGLALLSIAVLWMGLAFDLTFIWIALTLTCYLLFWALVVSLIIGLGRSSVFNSLSFIAVWVLLTVLFPATIQLYLQSQYDEHPALHATLEQRIVMANSSEQDQNALLASFIELYPQFEENKEATKTSSWLGYYIRQHMSDQAVDSFWQAYLTQQQQRQETLEQLSLLSPSLMFQRALNNIAGSSSEQHFTYIKQVADYHKQVREYLYPFMFQQQKINKTAIRQYPQFQGSQANTELPFGWILLGIFLLSGSMWAVYRGFDGQKHLN